MGSFEWFVSIVVIALLASLSHRLDKISNTLKTQGSQIDELVRKLSKPN
jgi:uncharacterized protein YoxC